jgi:predicted transcriptional regulator of viral defense system
MKLPRIYEHFRQGQIFTIDEAREKLKTTGNTLRKRLSELSSRGYIFPIRQGLYRVTKIGERPDLDKSSPFAIAGKLTPYSYVGFHSALQLHAKEVPKENDTIYVVSPTKFNSFCFEGIQYFWCQSPEPHGLETSLLNYNGLEFAVLSSNFEKSLVDCLKRPTHCPPFYELVRLCRKSECRPDIEKVLKYASDCNVQALFNRLGFLFEKSQSYWEIQEDFFKIIEHRMSRKQTEWPILYDSHKISGEHFNMVQSKGGRALGSSGVESKNRWKVQFSQQNH